MSDEPKTEEAPSFGGKFDLVVDDSKVVVIRHPNNEHLDNPELDQNPPEAA